jgi:hypothetical protein
VSRTIAFAALALLAAVAGYFVTASFSADTQRASTSAHPVWAEAAWPFPIDQWGQGWAYRCKAADCGTEVNLYVRPKFGFCNCQTGVADDAELDRVSDLDLLGTKTAALGPGQPIKVLWMKGRSRGYKVAAPSAKSVLELAFNNSCDVFVATVLAGDAPIAHEEAVLGFLNGDEMRNWAAQVLGL